MKIISKSCNLVVSRKVYIYICYYIYNLYIIGLYITSLILHGQIKWPNYKTFLMNRIQVHQAMFTLKTCSCHKSGSVLIVSRDRHDMIETGARDRCTIKSFINWFFLPLCVIMLYFAFQYIKDHTREISTENRVNMCSMNELDNCKSFVTWQGWSVIGTHLGFTFN